MAPNHGNYGMSQPPDPRDAGPTTGFHQSMASEGRHGQYQSRWATRRPAPGPIPLPLPDMQGPVIVPRGNAFFEGAISGVPVHARPSLASRMIGAGIGAVVGAKIYETVRARRSR